jgi:hypothetical protein
MEKQHENSFDRCKRARSFDACFGADGTGFAGHDDTIDDHSHDAVCSDSG